MASYPVMGASGIPDRMLPAARRAEPKTSAHGTDGPSTRQPAAMIREARTADLDVTRKLQGGSRSSNNGQ